MLAFIRPGRPQPPRTVLRALRERSLLLFDLARKSCSLVFADIDVQAVAGRLAATAIVASGQHSSQALLESEPAIREDSGETVGKVWITRPQKWRTAVQ